MKFRKKFWSEFCLMSFSMNFLYWDVPNVMNYCWKCNNFYDDLNTGKRKCNILERFAFVFEDFSLHMILSRLLIFLFKLWTWKSFFIFFFVWSENFSSFKKRWRLWREREKDTKAFIFRIFFFVYCHIKVLLSWSVSVWFVNL